MTDGIFRLFDDLGTELAAGHNTRLYLCGWALARYLLGDPAFQPNALYVEYANVVTPDTLIANPTVAKNSGLGYYDGLAGTTDRDYLRLYVRTPEIRVITGHEAYFAEGQGNLLRYRATTSGTTGIHGRPFAAAANSKVYGAALVATPRLDDRTQDVVLARGYYPQVSHKVKQPTGQLEVTYDFPLD